MYCVCYTLCPPDGVDVGVHMHACLWTHVCPQGCYVRLHVGRVAHCLLWKTEGGAGTLASGSFISYQSAGETLPRHSLVTIFLNEKFNEQRNGG